MLMFFALHSVSITPIREDPGPPCSGKLQSQRNVCQGNGKSVCTASVTEGEEAGRAVLPPRSARSARPTNQDRRRTSVFRIIPLTNIPLTSLRFLHPPSSIFALVAAGRAGCLHSLGTAGGAFAPWRKTAPSRPPFNQSMRQCNEPFFIWALTKIRTYG
jgi:hypothetical protein